MGFEKQRAEAVELCKKLLEEAKADVILGFTSGELQGSTIPFFIRQSQDLEAMKWDDTCAPTLAKYLLEKKGKTAIIAKPCDARAIVMYQVENQLNREALYIIGMECPGMKDSEGTLLPGCRECTVRIPPVYDVLIRSNDEIDQDVPSPQMKQDESEGRAESGYAEKLKQFQDEMKKCILCFSCRQVCYGCYCKTCFIDRDLPNWLPKELDMGAKMTFHLGRAMHLAGRCVECGACERACPSGVKIRYLIQELTDLSKEQYGYQAGMDPDEIPALSGFSPNDREIGFLGGEEDESCCDA